LVSGSDERIRPASFIAARSSACVGSLIGDLTRAGAGDEEAEDLPHSVVALLTDENVVFSGEGSSFAGEISTLGVEISLSGVDLGVSAAGLVGSVGKGRENRE
jgi:hypothetical protein